MSLGLGGVEEEKNVANIYKSHVCDNERGYLRGRLLLNVKGSLRVQFGDIPEFEPYVHVRCLCYGRLRFKLRNGMWLG